MPNVSGISRNVLKVSEVSVDKVLSHYLWNAAIPPKKEDMLTAVTSTERKPIHILTQPTICKMVQTNMLYWNFLQTKRSSEKFQTTLIIN